MRGHFGCGKSQPVNEKPMMHKHFFETPYAQRRASQQQSVSNQCTIQKVRLPEVCSNYDFEAEESSGIAKIEQSRKNNDISTCYELPHGHGIIGDGHCP